MILIVGLGNPGMKYKNTYHNLGFRTVDALAKRLKIKSFKAECDSHTALCSFNGRQFVLAKPDTYMNLSGQAVKKLVKKYVDDVSAELVVVYDDVDIEAGKLRMREEGSAGTHNGMRNIVAELATQQFVRLRIGTRTQKLASGEIQLIDFVLSKVDVDVRDDIDDAIERAADALLKYIDGEDLNRITEKINRK